MSLDTTDDPKALQGRIEMLAEALANMLVAVGVLRPDAECSGPELIVAAEGYLRNRVISEARFNAGVVALQHPAHLDVGAPVAREDGRFYIPVTRWPDLDGVSTTVLRIASDAFDELQSAEVFATVIAHAYNRLPGAVFERPTADGV
jgi:hypothetical protein